MKIYAISVQYLVPHISAIFLPLALTPTLALIMKYQLFGNSGLRVSEVCLGTMTFGEDWGWGSSEAEARKIYDRFREHGGNFIDTANVYTMGTSEKLLGEFMQGHRDEVVLATKYTNAQPGKDPNAGGNQRKNMMRSVEESLKRLKTDYIDLYWLHVWDSMTPIDEVMRGFDDLVSQGKILYAGVSDAPAWWISRANTIAELRGWAPFIGLQIEYSLLERVPERELLPMTHALGLDVVAWSPLAGGFLSGKYQVTAEGIRSESGSSRMDNPDMQQFLQDKPRLESVIDAVRSVAKSTGKSPAQVALAWLTNQPRPVTPIIGARRLDQLDANIEGAALQLSAEHMNQLNEASRINLGFPQDFFKKPMVRQLVHAGLADSIKDLGKRISS
jgi:aryl-alcohol dehydrogenase-like predicted oxidoreductase